VKKFSRQVRSRRSVGVLLAFLALLPVVSACTKHSTEAEIPSAARELGTNEKIVSVVLNDGTGIAFDGDGARVDNEAVVGLEDGMRRIIPITDVERVYVERKTTNVVATIGLVLGVTLIALTVASAVAIATKESCPFVYAWDGQRWVFDAEPYGGAISRGLERDDWGRLEHLRADGGEYRIRLTNEVNEVQYTNVVELWAVDHEPGAQIALDEWGGTYDVRDRVPPVLASDGTGKDLMPWLGATDAVVWEPRPIPDEDGELRRELILEFPKPEGAREAFLVTHIGTGQWGSHMIREFLTARGTGLTQWYSHVDTDPVFLASVYAWNLREELFALKIQVEESGGWVVRGAVPGGGPFITEDRVVRLDVSQATGERLRVRMEPPAGFWSLNSFAVTYSPDHELGPAPDSPALSVTRLTPIRAVHDDGRDVLSELAAVDDVYHVLPKTGDRAEVVFPAPPVPPGMERTVFVHARGWYRLNLDPPQPADLDLVAKLDTEPGAMHQFAADRYSEWSAAKLDAQVRKLESGQR